MLKELENDLAGLSEQDYGSDYRNHLLEIYKLYVETVDKIGARRQSANSFFLTLNSAIIALVGYVNLSPGKPMQASLFELVAVAGMILSYLWYRLIRSYRDINRGKFKVIHDIEAQLPIRPFDAEWTALGRGEEADLYLPFTQIEVYVPWVFFVIHLFVFLRSIPWQVFVTQTG